MILLFVFFSSQKNLQLSQVNYKVNAEMRESFYVFFDERDTSTLLYSKFIETPRRRPYLRISVAKLTSHSFQKKLGGRISVTGNMTNPVAQGC